MAEFIRKATEWDFPAIDSILVQESEYHIELEPDWMADRSGIDQSVYDEYLSASDKEILVCEREGIPVGVIQLSIGAGGDPGMKYQPFGSIDEIAVAEHCRGQGIGNKLMLAAESWARENELKMLRLEVWSKNQRAIGLYKKHKFEVIRHRMFREINDDDT